MSFKYICRISAAAVIAASLVSCSSGGLTGNHNPVPSKAQTSGYSSASSSQSSDVTSNQIDLWLANEDQWANADLMPEGGIKGIYSTGYYLFDIDLDGQKEMLVQLGGEQKQNCETLIYKADENNGIVQLKQKQDLSFSVQNLTLWTDKNGSMFYLNEDTLRTDENAFIVSWSRMSFENGILDQTPLFYQHVAYDVYTGNLDRMTYYASDGRTRLTDEQFVEDYNNYFKDCKQTPIEPLFIQSSDWAYYTDNQKLSALYDANQK